MLFSATLVYSQVGISKDNNFTPNAATVLDISSSDKGILIPRLKLTATNVFAPATTTSTEKPTSLLVYNTDTAGISPNNVVPGFYYWEGNKWVKIININELDLRLVGTNNHLTKDAGFEGAGLSAGTGSNNIGIGKSALNAITSGSDNVAIGENVLKLATNQSNAVGIGKNALASLVNTVTTTNEYPVAIGYNALKSFAPYNVSDSGRGNTAVGTSALTSLVNGSYNTALGATALSANSSNRNTAVGYASLGSNSTGTGNTALGSQAGGGINFADYNTFIGDKTASGWKPANVGTNILSKNIFIGSDLLSTDSNTNSNPNALLKSRGSIYIGSEILHHSNYANQISTINESLFLGFGSGPVDEANAEYLYSTAIGANSRVGASNSIVLGRVGTVSTSENRNGDFVGIGVLAPTNRLHIKPITSEANDHPIRIEGLKADATAINVLVVDEDGVLKTVAKSLVSSLSEPWLVQGESINANSNLQDIYQMGKVAIGADPSTLSGNALTAKLYIEKPNDTNLAIFTTGDIESTGKVYTSNSVFADYVFEKYFTGNSTINPTYDFKSLNAVKLFVKENHHLPGVTPIKDIAKTANGYKIDLAELSVQQLEKIEELYLHVIEQQEQIETKNKEIQDLKAQQAELNQRLSKLEELL